ncbi:hypothetical protein [Curtobacterium pusillum]|uniref:hypothetical protein n=1 Tax=Curtobacterium pusillum TaxID=69373 RepID=UPI0011A135EE|nr:hypothetical protein [Curtobacterium pusillum]
MPTQFDPMVGETDAMLRARSAGTVSDEALADWIDRAMTAWTSPLALQGAHLLNDVLVAGTGGPGDSMQAARLWWSQERTAYAADPAGWDRRYWSRYLRRLASPDLGPDLSEAEVDRRTAASHRTARRTAEDLVREGLIARRDADDVLHAAGLE